MSDWVKDVAAIWFFGCTGLVVIAVAYRIWKDKK